MPIFYKGAGPGTYLANHPPNVYGLKSQAPQNPASKSQMINHIVNSTTYSPFISLTASYGIAEGYASTGTSAIVSPSNPGWVFEIELDNPLPLGLTIIDPVKELADDSDLPNPVSYHHDGNHEFLLGVVSPTLLGGCLSVPAPKPPNSGATIRPANLSLELECISRVIRDSEVLVVGAVPKDRVINAYRIT